MNIPSVFGEPLVEAVGPALVNAWAVGYPLWRLGNPGSVGAVPVLLRDLPRGRTLRVESTGPRVHVMVGVCIDDVLLGWYRDTTEVCADFRVGLTPPGLDGSRDAPTFYGC